MIQESSRTIFEEFQKVYKQHPHREVIFSKEYRDYSSIAYEDLYGRALSLAAFLIRNNVREGDRVALILENGPHWPIAFLGIMRLGAVVVPLNPQASCEEMGNLLRHSGAGNILTSLRLYSKVKETVTGLGVNVHVIDSEEMAEEMESRRKI